MIIFGLLAKYFQIKFLIEILDQYIFVKGKI